MTRLPKLYSALAISLVAAYVLSLGGCSKAKDPWEEIQGGKLKVLVSFSPLYCFTTAVAGTDAKVQTLLSATGPHEHRATAADAHLAAGANLFLANGLNLDEQFVTTAANSSANHDIKIVKIAETALPAKEPFRLKMGSDHDHGDHGDHAGHDHGEWDPHAWLGIEQAILMVEKIRDELKKADAANGANYDRRAAEYVEKLKQLQTDGKKLLEGKKNRKLIAMHESLGYFCKSFDLDLVDSIMPRPGIEADANKMAELVKICQKDGVRLLAVEPQYRQDRAKTLAENLGKANHQISLIEIDPLETGLRDKLSPDYYLEVMRGNLKNLAEKMQ